MPHNKAGLFPTMRTACILRGKDGSKLANLLFEHMTDSKAGAGNTQNKSRESCSARKQESTERSKGWGMQKGRRSPNLKELLMAKAETIQTKD